MKFKQSSKNSGQSSVKSKCTGFLLYLEQEFQSVENEFTIASELFKFGILVISLLNTEFLLENKPSHEIRPWFKLLNTFSTFFGFLSFLFSLYFYSFLKKFKSYKILGKVASRIVFVYLNATRYTFLSNPYKVIELAPNPIKNKTEIMLLLILIVINTIMVYIHFKFLKSFIPAKNWYSRIPSVEDFIWQLCSNLAVAYVLLESKISSDQLGFLVNASMLLILGMRAIFLIKDLPYYNKEMNVLQLTLVMFASSLIVLCKFQKMPLTMVFSISSLGMIPGAFLLNKVVNIRETSILSKKLPQGECFQYRQLRILFTSIENKTNTNFSKLASFLNQETEKNTHGLSARACGFLIIIEDIKRHQNCHKEVPGCKKLLYSYFLSKYVFSFKSFFSVFETKYRSNVSPNSQSIFSLKAYVIFSKYVDKINQDTIKINKFSSLDLSYAFEYKKQIKKLVETEVEFIQENIKFLENCESQKIDLPNLDNRQRTALKIFLKEKKILKKIQESNHNHMTFLVPAFIFSRYVLGTQRNSINLLRSFLHWKKTHAAELLRFKDDFVKSNLFENSLVMRLSTQNQIFGRVEEIYGDSQVFGIGDKQGIVGRSYECLLPDYSRLTHRKIVKKCLESVYDGFLTETHRGFIKINSLFVVQAAKMIKAYIDLKSDYGFLTLLRIYPENHDLYMIVDNHHNLAAVSLNLAQEIEAKELRLGEPLRKMCPELDEALKEMRESFVGKKDQKDPATASILEPLVSNEEFNNLIEVESLSLNHFNSVAENESHLKECGLFNSSSKISVDSFKNKFVLKEENEGNLQMTTKIKFGNMTPILFSVQVIKINSKRENFYYTLFKLKRTKEIDIKEFDFDIVTKMTSPTVKMNSFFSKPIKGPAELLRLNFNHAFGRFNDPTAMATNSPKREFSLDVNSPMLLQKRSYPKLPNHRNLVEEDDSELEERSLEPARQEEDEASLLELTKELHRNKKEELVEDIKQKKVVAKELKTLFAVRLILVLICSTVLVEIHLTNSKRFKKLALKTKEFQTVQNCFFILQEGYRNLLFQTGVKEGWIPENFFLAAGYPKLSKFLKEENLKSWQKRSKNQFKEITLELGQFEGKNFFSEKKKVKLGTKMGNKIFPIEKREMSEFQALILNFYQSLTKSLNLENPSRNNIQEDLMYVYKNAVPYLFDSMKKELNRIEKTLIPNKMLNEPFIILMGAGPIFFFFVSFLVSWRQYSKLRSNINQSLRKTAGLRPADRKRRKTLLMRCSSELLKYVSKLYFEPSKMLNTQFGALEKVREWDFELKNVQKTRNNFTSKKFKNMPSKFKLNQILNIWYQVLVLLYLVLKFYSIDLQNKESRSIIDIYLLSSHICYEDLKMNNYLFDTFSTNNINNLDKSFLLASDNSIKLERLQNFDPGELKQLKELFSQLTKGSVCDYLKKKQGPDFIIKENACSKLDNGVADRGLLAVFYHNNDYLALSYRRYKLGITLANFLEDKQFQEFQFAYLSFYIPSIENFLEDLFLIFEKRLSGAVDSFWMNLEIISSLLLVSCLLSVLIVEFILDKELDRGRFCYELVGVDSIINNADLRNSFLASYGIKKDYFSGVN